MVEVDPYGAFSVNSVGLGHAPFPLSFSVFEAGGSWLVDATAAQAAELADVLMRAANGTIVVVGLETNSFLDEEYAPWRPSRIAAELGVDCQVHPVGALTSGVVGLSEEVLVIRRDDLPRFLADWSPYELTIVDVPGRPTPERVDEIVLALGTAGPDQAVLPALVGSSLWFSGHDDCYVAVESTDRAVPAAVLSRLLALLVGSALVDGSAVVDGSVVVDGSAVVDGSVVCDGSVVEVRDPDGGTVQRLIEESRSWVGLLGTVSEDSVTVDLSATSKRWRLGQRLPEQVDRRAVYDIPSGLWRLTDPRERG